MTALVFVGIGIGLFAQHALEATATGAMLEAKISLSYHPYFPPRPVPTSGLYAQHILDAAATGMMLEALHLFPTV